MPTAGLKISMTLEEVRPQLWMLTDAEALQRFARYGLELAADRLQAPLQPSELLLTLVGDWLTGGGWPESVRDDAVRKLQPTFTERRLNDRDLLLVVVADGSLLTCTGWTDYYDVRAGTHRSISKWATLSTLNVSELLDRFLERGRRSAGPPTDDQTSPAAAG